MILQKSKQSVQNAYTDQSHMRAFAKKPGGDIATKTAYLKVADRKELLKNPGNGIKKQKVSDQHIYNAVKLQQKKQLMSKESAYLRRMNGSNSFTTTNPTLMMMLTKS